MLYRSFEDWNSALSSLAAEKLPELDLSLLPESDRHRAWEGRQSPYAYLQHLTQGVEPSSFGDAANSVNLSSCLHTSEGPVVPFQAKLLADLALAYEMPRPAMQGGALKYLLGWSLIGTGLLFLVMAVAGLVNTDDWVQTGIGLASLFGSGAAVLAYSVLLDAKKSTKNQIKAANFEEKLRQASVSVAVTAPIGRTNASLGAIGACETSNELLIVAGSSKVMSLPCHLIKSVKAMTNTETAQIGGAAKVEGVWLGLAGNVSTTTFTGVSLLLDDLQHPRLTIELPTAEDASRWEDIITLMIARSSSSGRAMTDGAR